MVAGTGSNLNLREGATIRTWERKKAARLGAADIRDLAIARIVGCGGRI